MAENRSIKLEGRIFITFDIAAQTGLHIGGSDTGIEIGGVDKTVIRDRLTNRPYIPGSSLRGKMRSLLEKYKGLQQNQRIGQGNIHSCQQSGDYDACPVCQVFGVPGERDFGTPTRLVVRDAHMTDASAKALQDRTELPYTEAKTEVSIDRVTSAANPRQFERVPAGAVFGPAELLFTVYNGSGCDPRKDIERVATVVEGLQLLEDDYLGGQGSRGAGQVELKNIVVKVRRNYPQEKEAVGNYGSLSEWAADLSRLQDDLRARFGLGA
ncbi:MAG: type III-A CRISPR-associated RAMP protein Csm3 [Caldilineaceae bacterium SB0665_bin_25]|nr:type III-A CRISPR-associated RAMP protein Csm3 [Caldilineaceae bacterium SB0665_bin_25]